MVSSNPIPDATTGLPFPSKFCLAPLLDIWKSSDGCHPVLSRVSQEVQQLRESHSELFEPTADVTRFHANEDLVRLLLAPVLSSGPGNFNLVAVARPFVDDFIYATPGFRHLLLDSAQRLKARPKSQQQALVRGRQLAAYAQVAWHCHGLELDIEASPTYVVEDPDSGLRRHYQFRFDCQYLRVEQQAHASTVSPEKIEQLRQNPRDLNLWQTTLPPGNYELQGFVLVHAVDITARESVSIVQEAYAAGMQLISREGIALLTRTARDLVRQPNLTVRLFARQGNRGFMISSDACGQSGCLISNSRHFDHADFSDSIYEQAKQTGFLFVRDCEKELHCGNKIHRVLLDAGVKSLLVVPIRDGESITGMLELDFLDDCVASTDVALRIGDLSAIVALGLKQGREFLEQSISAVIQKRCSVVHPSVDWRFRQAALDLITSDDPSDFGPIVFGNVHPLYSQADIKDSSAFRNRAIQSDLIAQLRLARNVLRCARQVRAMPLLEEMEFQIDGYLSDLDQELRSGDELSVGNFLKLELEPVFAQLRDMGDRVGTAIDGYQRALDPRYGMLHERRSEYERSVEQLNDAIAGLLADLEPQAQEMFPFYFEKTFTDGAEMMIYVGSALVEDGKFDAFYLRNLRLWQFRISCQIARLCNAILPQLALPLAMTHLILVQDAPLSIRFSETERNFIVDGAYNIRYEIMKKRIDKALIKNGTERLTQPGKIAIVYSHSKEALEYQRYIRYLQSQGWLTGEVEDLELESLQGLQGLRALRVSVALADTGSHHEGSQQAIATNPEPENKPADRNLAKEMMAGALPSGK